MDEHEGFITAIESQPDDDTARLVYADWLDERGDPAGEYLRTEVALAALPEGSDAAPELRGRLRSLRSRIDPAWLARLDQPRVMRANPTPFPSGWWGVALPGVRDFDATYQFFDSDTLPPLRHPPFTGAFGWLPPAKQPPVTSADQSAFADHVNRLVQHLTGLGLTVPLDFVRWLTDASLCRVPSCTDCYPDRPWGGVAVAGSPGARVVSFYIDSQGSPTWCLYLTPDGYSAVVASQQFVCWDWTRSSPSDGALDNPDPPDEDPGFVFVAPSVEAFLYRWWVENALWFKLADPMHDFHDPAPLTAEEQAYLDWYRRHPPPAT